MSEQTIRPYSMLIYGLQDDFIGVLKPESLESKGHVTDPKVTLKNDGTQELNFSIPMYYTDETTGQRILNPMWAKTRDNELIANLRKIKVVLAPVIDGVRTPSIFEFVITSKNDKHSGGTLECELKGEGLAYRELGGTGYKLSLTQDDFLVEYNDWADRLTDPSKKLTQLRAEKTQLTTEITATQTVKNALDEEYLTMYNTGVVGRVNVKQKLLIQNSDVATEDADKGIDNVVVCTINYYNKNHLSDSAKLSYTQQLANLITIQDYIIAQAQADTALQAAQEADGMTDIDLSYESLNSWLSDKYLNFTSDDKIAQLRSLLFLTHTVPAADVSTVQSLLIEVGTTTDMATTYASLAGYVEQDIAVSSTDETLVAEYGDKIATVKLLADYINRYNAYVNLYLEQEDGTALSQGSQYYQTLLANDTTLTDVYKEVTDDYTQYLSYVDTITTDSARLVELGDDTSGLIGEQKVIVDGLETESEPHMSINYWCDKVFDSSTAWTYRIDMNWDAYEAGRDSSKIYEEEYVDKWSVVDGKMVPQSIQPMQEKYRAVSCTDSNRYNITQDIAKAFGVYCRYEYTYDDDYHIIGRTAVFYNNFFQEEDNVLDVNYPYQLSDVTRTIESTDVVTKMYVKTIEDSDQVSGIVSIGDAEANKSGEDYILNFEYLKSVGSLTDEQYDAIADFETLMHDYNARINGLSAVIAEDNTSLTEYKATAANANEAVKQAAEIVEEQKMTRDSIFGASGIVTRGTETGSYSSSSILSIASTSTGSYGDIASGYDYRINIIGSTNSNDSGIIADTVHLYYLPTTDTSGKIKTTEVSTDYYSLVYYTDSNGFTDIIGADIKAAAFSSATQTSHQLYWCYQCTPSIKYDQMVDLYTQQEAQQYAKYEEATAKVDQLTTEIETATTSLNTYLAAKEQAMAEFERLMGPAIREGNWSDDDYKDYGQKTVEDGATITWDTELFDDEDKNYEEQGVDLTKHYFPMAIIDLTTLKAQSIDLNNLWFCYTATSKGVAEVHKIGANAGFVYQYLQKGGKQYAAIVITDNTDVEAYYEDEESNFTDACLAEVEQTVTKQTQTDGTEKYVYDVTYTKYINFTVGTDLFFDVDDASHAVISQYETVYPRFIITDETLKTSTDKFTLKVKNSDDTYATFEKYSQYSILFRQDTGWLITPIPYQLMTYAIDALNPWLWISYELSSACTSLYLDALEVMKTNAFPKVSYSITLAKVPTKVLQTLPSYLNRIVHINDHELFLDEVSGYISEMVLNLDAPWEDTVTTKDYKTKFEDLFSSIVASTEQMKTNGAAYDAAAAAFSVSGDSTLINENTLQQSINHYNLSQQFDQGTLTMDNEHGIWATSEEGVVAMTGGGIFCATEKDAMDQWVWHTGLTPIGINASLITTGHLDTNLIKIFSGDNVALQLDKNGLFAYKSYIDADSGDTKYLSDTYVVHNENGLFFTEKNDDDVMVDRVEISWDGLKIRNSENEEVFYIDPDTGNLVLDQAVISHAVIEDVELGEMSQLPKGINLTELSGTEFKYDNDTHSYDPSALTWAITAVYVTPEDSVTLEDNLDAFIISYGYTEPTLNPDYNDDHSNWRYDDNPSDWVTLTTDKLKEGSLVQMDDNHLTIRVKSGIMNNNGTCYIRVQTRCRQDNYPDKLWYGDTVLTVFAVRDGEQGEDGTSGVTCAIVSSIGTTIKNSTTSDFTLTMKLFQDGQELDGTAPYQYEYTWTSNTDSTFSMTGKEITLGAKDIDNITTFTCTVTMTDEQKKELESDPMVTLS